MEAESASETSCKSLTPDPVGKSHEAYQSVCAILDQSGSDHHLYDVMFALDKDTCVYLTCQYVSQ
jgi:hypothetical protein